MECVVVNGLKWRWSSTRHIENAKKSKNRSATAGYAAQHGMFSKKFTLQLILAFLFSPMGGFLVFLLIMISPFDLQQTSPKKFLQITCKSV